MTILIALFGILIAAACIWGIVAPRYMVDKIVKFWNQPAGLWLAIGVRVVVGVLFILAAAETRYPTFFQIFGVLILVAAAAIPIVGKERLTRLINWFTGMPTLAIRLWLIIGLAFSLFIVYAVV
jgi:hypothetical protein